MCRKIIYKTLAGRTKFEVRPGLAGKIGLQLRSPNRSKNAVPLDFFRQEAPEAPGTCPKMPQDAQERLKMFPRWRQSVPKTPPRRSQTTPAHVPKWPQSVPRNPAHVLTFCVTCPFQVRSSQGHVTQGLHDDINAMSFLI